MDTRAHRLILRRGVRILTASVLLLLWSGEGLTTTLRFDLVTPGDGKIFFDDQNGLYRLAVGFTRGLAAQDFCDYEGGAEDCALPLIGEGWRHATGAESGDILSRFDVAPETCPDGLRSFGSEEPAELADELLAAIDYLGRTWTGLEGKGGRFLVVRPDSVIGNDPEGLGLLHVEEFLDLAASSPDDLLAGEVSVELGGVDVGDADDLVGHLLLRGSLPPRVWPELPGAAGGSDPAVPSTRSPCVLGAVPYEGGTKFRVWAPGPEEGPHYVAVLDAGVLPSFEALYDPAADKGFSTYLALETEEHLECWTPDSEEESVSRLGIWSADVPGVAPGSAYRFLTHVVRHSNVWIRRDPRGRWVDSSQTDGNSLVYDANAFDWQGQPEPVPDPDPEFGVTCPRDELASWVLYKVSVTTFDDSRSGGPHGDFDAVLNRLDQFEALGVNAILFHPLAEFPDANDLDAFPGQRGNGFAVLDNHAIESDYGGPDKLKELVRELHARDFSVMVDVEFTGMMGRDSTRYVDGWCSEEFLYGWLQPGVPPPESGQTHPVSFRLPADLTEFDLSDSETQLIFPSRWSFAGSAPPLSKPGRSSVACRAGATLRSS